MYLKLLVTLWYRCACNSLYLSCVYNILIIDPVVIIHYNYFPIGPENVKFELWLGMGKDYIVFEFDIGVWKSVSLALTWIIDNIANEIDIGSYYYIIEWKRLLELFGVSLSYLECNHTCEYSSNLQYSLYKFIPTFKENNACLFKYIYLYKHFTIHKIWTPLNLISSLLLIDIITFTAV